MSLTNPQYDTIMREYDEIRTRNRHLQDARYEEACNACPEIAAIDQQMISVSLAAAKTRIESTPDQPGSAAAYPARMKQLLLRREACLASIGKPADYLDPVYTCPLCHDTGYIGQQKCTCFQKKAVDLVYRDSNLKNMTDRENFSHFSLSWYAQDKQSQDPATGLTPYQNMKNILASCQSFTKNFDREHQNLLFFGSVGTGKTFLTNCIARELLDSSHSVIYLTAVELFQRFSANTAAYSNAADQVRGTWYLQDCDLLIIDDLGTELSNSFTNSCLFYLINERILRRKSTIISTNFSLNKIQEVYSERVSSRIVSAYQLLKFFGSDIRLQKKRQERLSGRENEKLDT